MTSITVTTRGGDQIVLSAGPGLSVMEIVRDNGIDEMQAICGGCCSCSTCHVYIDAGMASLLPPIGPDEDELLDSSTHRTARSRLACQVTFTDALDGLSLTIAPED